MLRVITKKRKTKEGGGGKGKRHGLNNSLHFGGTCYRREEKKRENPGRGGEEKRGRDPTIFFVLLSATIVYCRYVGGKGEGGKSFRKKKKKGTARFLLSPGELDNSKRRHSTSKEGMALF